MRVGPSLYSSYHKHASFPSVCLNLSFLDLNQLFRWFCLVLWQRRFPHRWIKGWRLTKTILNDHRICNITKDYIVKTTRVLKAEWSSQNTLYNVQRTYCKGFQVVHLFACMDKLSRNTLEIQRNKRYHSDKGEKVPVKVAEHNFGSLWVYVICQIMARGRLQLTSWNLASEKYTDERFWLTGKIWRFHSFHGNMNDWIQP